VAIIPSTAPAVVRMMAIERCVADRKRNGRDVEHDDARTWRLTNTAFLLKHAREK
jgi:hypothetical protein